MAVRNQHENIYSMIEAIGYLAQTPEGTIYRESHFQKKGMLKTIKLLARKGLVSKVSGDETSYFFNQQGRDYAERVLDEAYDLLESSRKQRHAPQVKGTTLHMRRTPVTVAPRSGSR